LLRWIAGRKLCITGVTVMAPTMSNMHILRQHQLRRHNYSQGNPTHDQKTNNNNDLFAIPERKHEDDDNSTATGNTADINSELSRSGSREKPSRPKSRVYDIRGGNFGKFESEEEEDGDGKNSYPPTLNNMNNNSKNHVEFMDLKEPAPDASYQEDYENDMMDEYEYEIQRLKKLNANLTANVATLTAAALDDGDNHDNTAVVEVERCQTCRAEHELGSIDENSATRSSFNQGKNNNRTLSMDITPNDDYTPLNNDIFNDMILTEEHYMHQISKLQKSTHKLQKKLESKKKLVSQLSLNLKTAAEKITQVDKEKEDWQGKFEKLTGEKKSQQESQKQDENTKSKQQIHHYQTKVLENELQKLLRLISQKTKLHSSNRQQLINDYRSHDNAFLHNKLEKPEETLQRVMRKLRIGDEVDDWHTLYANSSDADVAPAVQEAKEPKGVNVWDSVTSLFGGPSSQQQQQQQQQQTKEQANVDVDEQQFCNEIKSFDKKHLRKTPPGYCDNTNNESASIGSDGDNGNESGEDDSRECLTDPHGDDSGGDEEVGDEKVATSALSSDNISTTHSVMSETHQDDCHSIESSPSDIVDDDVANVSQEDNDQGSSAWLDDGGESDVIICNAESEEQQRHVVMESNQDSFDKEESLSNVRGRVSKHGGDDLKCIGELVSGVAGHPNNVEDYHVVEVACGSIADDDSSAESIDEVESSEDHDTTGQVFDHHAASVTSDADCVDLPSSQVTNVREAAAVVVTAQREEQQPDHYFNEVESMDEVVQATTEDNENISLQELNSVVDDGSNNGYITYEGEMSFRKYSNDENPNDGREPDAVTKEIVGVEATLQDVELRCDNTDDESASTSVASPALQYDDVSVDSPRNDQSVDAISQKERFGNRNEEGGSNNHVTVVDDDAGSRASTSNNEPMAPISGDDLVSSGESVLGDDASDMTGELNDEDDSNGVVNTARMAEVGDSINTAKILEALLECAQNIESGDSDGVDSVEEVKTSMLRSDDEDFYGSDADAIMDSASLQQNNKGVGDSINTAKMLEALLECAKNIESGDLDGVDSVEEVNTSMLRSDDEDLYGNDADAIMDSASLQQNNTGEIGSADPKQLKAPSKEENPEPSSQQHEGMVQCLEVKDGTESDKSSNATAEFDDGSVGELVEQRNHDDGTDDDTDDEYVAREAKDVDDSHQASSVFEIMAADDSDGDDYNPKEGKSAGGYFEDDESDDGDEPDAVAVMKVDEESQLHEISGLNDVHRSYIGIVAASQAGAMGEEESTATNHIDVASQERHAEGKADEEVSLEQSSDKEAYVEQGPSIARQLSIASDDVASNVEVTCINEEPSTTSTEIPPDEGIPSLIEVRSMTSRSPTRTITSSTTAITDESQALIAAALEEKYISANKTLADTLEMIQEQSKARMDGSEDEDRSLAYYHNVISNFTKPAASNTKKKDDVLSNRLSRRQLFQRQGSSCADLFVDIVNDVFNKPEDRQVLVTSNDIDKYHVPRYKPPVLPPQRKKGAPSFKKGQKEDGYYLYKSSSGNEYAGHWKNGRRHGYGIAKYRDGEIFHGEWRRGRRHGHGVLHLANSEVFDGDWFANKKHGLGVYYWQDGEVDISWYQDDVRLESLRWTKDRRRAYLLDLSSSRKEQLSLVRAANIVKGWERKRETYEC